MYRRGRFNMLLVIASSVTAVISPSVQEFRMNRRSILFLLPDTACHTSC
jgi:hypothetical protein